MQIFGNQCYSQLIIFIRSVFRFQKRFLESLLGVLNLMDYVTWLKHLAPDYELGFGFFLFCSLKEVYEILGLFLLFVFGLKSLYSSWISRVLVPDLRGKSGELKKGFCSKEVIDSNCGLLKFLEEESLAKSNSYVDSEIKMGTQSDEEHESDDENYVDLDYDEEEYDEFDVSKLRKLKKTERIRANEAVLELEKERAAAATAAEEAMAMILRLQNEKSSIELEFNQYRRLAEEKRIHDQEVIRSLQWLVWRFESDRSLLQDEITLCRRKMDRCHENDERDGEFEEVKETTRCSSGCSEDVLENVLYSSLDFKFSPKWS